MSGTFVPQEAPSQAPSAPPPVAQPSHPTPERNEPSRPNIDAILGDFRVSDRQLTGEEAPPANLSEGEPAPQPSEAPAAPPRPNPAASAPPGYVPQQALAQARMEAKERQDQLEGRLSALTEMMTNLARNVAPPQDAPPPPDEHTDPLGHMKWRFEALQRSIQQQATQNEQIQAYTRQQQQEAQFRQAYEAQAQAFMAENPNFPAAYGHFYNQMKKIHSRVPGITPEIADQSVRQQERAIAEAAMRAGVNPAQAILEVAQELGWQQAQPPGGLLPMGQVQHGGPQPMQANHQAVPAQYRNPEPNQGWQAPTPDHAGALAAIQAGQQASRTLNGGVPGSAGLSPSLQNLIGANLDEFAQATSGANWSRLMGGS